MKITVPLPSDGEYLVASELSKRGYDVKILGKRRGPDLRIQSAKATIEVKLVIEI